MTFEPGTWVELPDGGIARIVEIDEANGVVLAATADGHPIDRPAAVAEKRWRPLKDSDLRVQRTLEPDRIARLAADDPVALVVAVISDCGGSAKLGDLRSALTPVPISPEGFETWWKNVQRRLASDPRVDASYARTGTYRSASSLGDRGAPPGDPVTDERRGGRLIADARLLLRARALVGEARGTPPENRRFVEQEAILFKRRDLDATDRLLSFDLAARAGLTSATEAAAELGEDLLRVDLLRIRDKATRLQTLEWATRYVHAIEEGSKSPLAAGSTPLLASSGALGDEFERLAIGVAQSLGLSRDAVVGGRLGWGVPGSEEAGKPKYPDDLEGFDKRLARWEGVANASDPADLRSTAAGAVDALQVLHDSRTHHQQWLRLMDRLASVVWEGTTSGDALALIQTRHRRLRPDAAEALVRVVGRSNLEHLKPVVLDWFKADPDEYRNVLLDFASRAGSDPVGLVLQIARAEIAATKGPSLAATAFDMARSTGRDDDLMIESANLAGTVAANHPGVADALEERAAELIQSLLAEQPASVGSAWFTARNWQALETGVLDSLRTARREAAQSDAAAAELKSEVARLEQALQYREQALSNTRTGQATEERNANQRVAANSLRPVVKALADSFESNSLPSVQEALMAVLARARIEPIGKRGDTVQFNPLRHRWVGEGMAVDQALVISPGFVLRGELAEDDVVLVPARVVDPRHERALG